MLIQSVLAKKASDCYNMKIVWENSQQTILLSIIDVI